MEVSFAKAPKKSKFWIKLEQPSHCVFRNGRTGYALPPINHIFLGKRNREFSFANLNVPKNFCEISVLNTDIIDKIQVWISSISFLWNVFQEYVGILRDVEFIWEIPVFVGYNLTSLIRFSLIRIFNKNIIKAL